MNVKYCLRLVNVIGTEVNVRNRSVNVGAMGALLVGLLAGYMHQHVPTVMLSNIVLKRNGTGALGISKRRSTDRAPECDAIFASLTFSTECARLK